MENPLGRHGPGANIAAANDRQIHWRRRRILWRRNGRRPESYLSILVDEDRDRFASMGAGILGRRRRDLGDKLDHDVHATISSELVAQTSVSGFPPRSD